MITVEDREQIRRGYFVEHKRIRALAREFRHSRPTIRKALADADPGEYTLKAPREAPVLGAYRAQIDKLLAESENLPRKQRYTAHRIFERLRGEGYSGGESTVRAYVARQRQAKRHPALYLPLEYDPGMDAQVDWGEAAVEMGGARRAVQLFVMRLCYSRRLFVRAYPTQKQESFFEGHVHAFRHFGGVPRRLIYDNLGTAVLRVLEGHNREEQRAFVVFRSHYLFESRYCTPGEGHDAKRAGWKAAWGMPGAISWSLCQSWPISRLSTPICWRSV
jgi:transposase